MCFYTAHGQCPVEGFPRGSGTQGSSFLEEQLDWVIKPVWARVHAAGSHGPAGMSFLLCHVQGCTERPGGTEEGSKGLHSPSLSHDVKRAGFTGGLLTGL